MEDRNILLTYKNKDGLYTYEWFENNDELLNFMKEEFKGEVMECIKIENAKNITNIIADYLKE